MRHYLTSKKIKAMAKTKTKNSPVNSSFDKKDVSYVLRLIKEKDIQILGLKFNDLANLLTGHIRQSLVAKVKK